MTVTINGTSGVTYPAGGTDNVAGAGVGTTDTQTLSNKTIASLVTTGTATFGGLINTGSTGQIQFPATQNPSSDANTLDDYEEGTWTAVGNGVTLTTSDGWYVKIGKVVCVGAQLAWPTNSNGNAATLNGLPFAASSASSNFMGAVSITNYGSDNIYVFVSAGDARVFIRNNNNNDLTNANLSTKFVEFMASYIV